MDKNTNSGSCADSCEPAKSCCKVENVISVDERGVMVLPKEIRDKAGIRPGDKLAVITWDRDGRVCCITLVKSEELAGMVKDLLSPMIEGLANK